MCVCVYKYKALNQNYICTCSNYSRIARCEHIYRRYTPESLAQKRIRVLLFIFTGKNGGGRAGTAAWSVAEV